MANGLSIIDKDQRKQINEKFESLTLKFDLDRLWPETVATEKEDLQLFLLTSPNINNVIEYLDEKIQDWMIAEKSSAENRKTINKMITVFELLIGYVDGIGR